MAADDPAPEFMDEPPAPALPDLSEPREAAGREPIWSLVAGIVLFLAVLTLYWGNALVHSRQLSAPTASVQLRLQTYQVEANLYFTAKYDLTPQFRRALGVRELAERTARAWGDTGKDAEDGPT
ncbi:MAG TPA: hypothetical protein VGM23_05760, partial [Armatimonadota bacterium]